MQQRFFTLEDVSFSLTQVEGGTFFQGAQNTDSLGRNYDSDAYEEGPVREVTLPDFHIAPIVLTQDLWLATGRKLNDAYQTHSAPDLPVTGVNATDVLLFLEYLNSRLHRDGQLQPNEKFRLPSEDQWEYAARGGNRSKGFRMAGGLFLQELGWAEGKVEIECAQPVARKQPNELGLYDMSGNVWEMTTTRDASKGLLAKGGAWDSVYDDCRITARKWFSPVTRSRSLGFRLALY